VKNLNLKLWRESNDIAQNSYLTESITVMVEDRW